ncbi:hypothetical protein KFL_006890040 [Klebsormidium nitens]|uniref:ENT domain-containing protein n=1 Tax=Klebsormidium nitens TaxID=105231 RepID=A0A1Y1IMY3_KLENI|nr:hypothetical protein KFL_006890040 [Klebsormidium nitens]|eukprot:GAQ90819.1 hypothetical protein KFL_006890040 [Klebsormidium nitens]
MQSDSNTDDDNSPPPENRYGRGSGRAGGGGPKEPARGGGSDYGAQLRQLQQDAYTGVMRAFMAQSNNIGWDEEELLVGLRKSLHVAEETHRSIVQAERHNEGLRRIREGLQQRGGSGGYGGAMTHYDGTPGAGFGPAKTAPPPSLAARGRGGALGATKGRGGAPSGRGRGGRPGRAAGPAGSLPVGLTINEHVGKRVETLWDEDGWYQAIISDYNPDTDMHCLIYNINTPDEQWEWISLAEVGDNLRFVGPADPSLLMQAGQPLLAGARGLSAAKERKERGEEGLEGAGLPGLNLGGAASLEEIDRAKEELKRREEELRQQLEDLGSDDEDEGEEGEEQLPPMGPPPDDDEDEGQRRRVQRGRHPGHEQDEDEGDDEEDDDEDEDDEEDEEDDDERQQR